MKKLLQMLFQRVVIVGLLILLQIAILVVMVLRFDDYFVYFYAVCIAISLFSVLYIISNKENPAYKIAWIIPIMLVPFFGGLFYLLFGGQHLSQHEYKKMHKISEHSKAALVHPQPVMEKLQALDNTAALQSNYIYRMAYSPPYEHTSTEFLPMGEVKFQRMLEELRKAEHYIFLEYFIIQEGKMWNSILEILEQKVQQGLDVRVMYDDLGCIRTLPDDYARRLEEKGIQCCVFNRFIPVLSLRFNNRNHRKICVIDGHTGFTGGINLADEYINEYPKHGHWKDCAILLRGDAVWSLTVMFLSMWDYIRDVEEDYSQFQPNVYLHNRVESDGFVQPFTDTPLDDEAVGETVYMNLVSRAKRYVYINTPYLILSYEMNKALCTAAKCGIDVRIVTPHVPDKWYVHPVTRAYYAELVESGVKIYEYTPGFIHAKTFVVDDEYGVVGTINLDYRSLYLHFECAAWLYRCSCIADLREDYLKTLEVCEQITVEACRKTPWLVRLGRSILKVFAPLM